MLFTALIAPYFIDWTAYKTDFERQASRIIGQKVEVDGKADVRLLPLPSISFSKLSVGQNAENEPMMTVDRFSANVELFPFLSGEVKIVNMELDSPVFNLDIDESGKIAWTERQEVLVDPDQVKLDRLKISNAAFNLKGISPDGIVRGEKISADVSALSLYGPWNISGSGLVDGQNSRFEISTGRLSDDQSLRLKTRMVRLDKPYELSADGVIALKENILSWGGKFDLKPISNKDFRLENTAQPALPVTVSGDFNLNPNELALPEYRIDIGNKDDPYTLSGIGRAKLKGGVDFQLQIDGRQVDINRIAKMRDGEGAVANTMEERLALFGRILEQIPVPQFKGTIDFEIPAIIAGDTFIREVSAVVRPFGNDWEIVRFKSSFPGNTLIEAKGRLSSGETFGFHGDMVIASTQPSGFAAWAAGEVDPAIRRLSSAGLSADVTLTAEQINLEEMELILDGNRLIGDLRRLRPVQSGNSISGEDGSLPAIIANLEGDLVRLEDLRAIATLLAGEESVTLNNDFDVSLKASRLSGFDLEANDVDLQFQYKNGELSISRLDAKDFLGTNLKSTGQIANVLEQSKGNISIDLDADNLTQLLAVLGERIGWNPVLRAFADDPALSQETSLKIVLDSSEGDDNLGRSRFLVSGVSAGTNISMRGGFRGSLARFENVLIENSVEADNPNGVVLLKQIGLQAAGFDPFYGELETPLKLVFETSGSGQDGYSTILSVNTDDTAISAKGLISELGDEKPSLNFDVTLGSQNISPFVTSFGYFLPELNSVLGDEAPLSARFNWQSDKDNPGKITIENGQIYGNGFSGVLSRVTGAADKASIEGELVFDQISLGLLAALATGQPLVDELGGWSKTEFSTPPFKGENGKLSLSAQIADIGLEERANDLKLSLSVNDGDVSVDAMSAGWNGADVSGNLSVTNAEGTSAVNGQFTVAGATSEGIFRNLGLEPFVFGETNLVGNIEASGKSPLALIGSMVGSGLVEIQEGKIEGVGNNAIAPILSEADNEGFEINAGTVKPLVSDVFTKGMLNIADLQAPFSISRGKLLFRNIPLTGAAENARTVPIVSSEIDLIEETGQTEIRLFPDPGKERVSGANPDIGLMWSGPLRSPQLEIDSASMEGYLSIRSFENEQRRVETLQASILEKQRFRYELLKSRSRDQWLIAKQQEEERLAKEEAERLAREEAERIAAEEARKEAERLAAEEARKEAERLAAEEEERIRLQTEKLLQAEKRAAEAAERKRIEEAAAAAKQEADRIAAEKAAEAEKAPKAAEADQTANQQKTGFEIKSLDAPRDTNAPDIFRNIEELLNAQ